MLIKESEYINNIIENIKVPREAKILNIGSQDNKYLKANCHIIENVINPAQKKGFEIINFDILPGEGINIHGDIFDNRIYKRLTNLNIDVIFLFNVLEHVIDIKSFIEKVEGIVNKDGFIFVSVPFKYPIHFDPIDNGFRPNVEELGTLFEKCTIQDGKIVIDYSFNYYLFRSIKSFFSGVARLLVPFYRFKKWRTVVVPKFFWINKTFCVTCVLLKKIIIESCLFKSMFHKTSIIKFHEEKYE